MDAHKNAAYSLVATAPSPATSGTSLVVTAGEGARFPAVPFNATVWATGAQPNFAAGGTTGGNFEIVRVTAISTDTLTITRAQESTTARSIVVGDQIAATITAKTLTDAETLNGVLVGSGAGTTHTGDLTETSLATIAIPAGLIGANGMVEIIFMVERAASETSNIGWKVRFGASGSGTGGTQMVAQNQSITNIQARMYYSFYNVASASVQHAPTVTPVAPFGFSTVAVTTAAINTGNASEVNITAVLGTNGDTAKLMNYYVKVYPHS